MSRDIDTDVFARISAQGVQDSVYMMSGRVMKPRRHTARCRLVLYFALWVTLIYAWTSIPNVLRGHEPALSKALRVE